MKILINEYNIFLCIRANMILMVSRKIFAFNKRSNMIYVVNYNSVLNILNNSIGAKSNLETSVNTRRYQTYLLQVDLQNEVYLGWIDQEIQCSYCSSRVLSTIWTRL